MSSKDVEMKPVDSKKLENKDDKKKDDKEKEVAPAPPPPTPAQEIKTNVALIERGVSTLEPRFTNRVLRNLTALRKRLDDGVLREALGEVYVKGMCIHPTTLRKRQRS